MTRPEVLKRRLAAQHLAGSPADTPKDAVRRLLGVQSQERVVAFWSLAQRSRGQPSLTDVVAAYDVGDVLRTHTLRQTWHFVAPEDLRLVLQVTSPRVEQAAGTVYRKYALDEDLRERATEVMLRRVAGGRHATKAELAAALAEAGIQTTGGIPLSYLVMHAELRGRLVSGPMRGLTHTYAAVDERVPPAPVLDADEALAELTVRFFLGHGPAALPDLTRWASLTVAQARRGLDVAADRLGRAEVDGVPHWFDPVSVVPARDPAYHGAHLLQLYDEATLTYPRLGFPVDPAHPEPPGLESRFGPVLAGLRDVGIWRRAGTGRGATVEVAVSPGLSGPEREAVEGQRARLARFLGAG